MSIAQMWSNEKLPLAHLTIALLVLFKSSEIPPYRAAKDGVHIYAVPALAFFAGRLRFITVVACHLATPRFRTSFL